MRARIAFVLLTVALGAASASGLAQNVELIKQAAATNGGVVIVRDALFASLHQAMTQAFNAEYKKYGLSARIERVQSGQQLNLYEQELRASKVSNDIMALVDPGTFLGLNRQGKYTPHCSPHYKDYPQWAVGKDCGYFYYVAYYQYLAYNPDMVKGNDIPRSWNDLLDPKWKGKVSLPDPKIGGGHYYFVFTMMKLFGKGWFEKMRRNDPLLVSSHGTVNSQIMSGERLVGVNISVLSRRDGRFPGGKGSPIAESFPKDGVTLLAGGMAVTKGGPNTPGGKVFIEWASSLAGQKAIARLGHISLRKDYTSDAGDDLSKIKYNWWDPEEMLKNRDEWTREALKALGAS
ncbi:MAG: extracellular solute-binding protein [Betaproteobacteria bacterium]|nr:extracellular solute-binding protein [Betaproteobacteria bacterium]MBI3935566.1 extracellular solute-binding protein [Betaproteobacteria bacterium]